MEDFRFASWRIHYVEGYQQTVPTVLTVQTTKVKVLTIDFFFIFIHIANNFFCSNVSVSVIINMKKYVVSLTIWLSFLYLT